MHTAAARVVEMDADKDGVRRAISDRDPLIERNEDIRVARHDGPQLRLSKLAIEPLRDVERNLLFRRSVTPHRAAIFAAMTGIDHYGGEAAARVLPPGYFVRGAARERETRRDQAKTSEGAEHSASLC